MSALLEYQCRPPVGGYDIITIELPGDPEEPQDPPRKVRVLQPRSERTRRFDLFKANPSAFLEFAQTPPTENGIKDFADRYGGSLGPGPGQVYIDYWCSAIREMHQAVELWQKSKMTGDFRRINRCVEELFYPRPVLGMPVYLLLKKDPLNGSASLCIRPDRLHHALWVQLLLAIDGNLNLRGCVQCRKWFTLEAGRGRSDKEYCSNACRMRAYRKRKGTG
jgi:hypothetical protein